MTTNQRKRISMLRRITESLFGKSHAGDLHRFVFCFLVWQEQAAKQQTKKTALIRSKRLIFTSFKIQMSSMEKKSFRKLESRCHLQVCCPNTDRTQQNNRFGWNESRYIKQLAPTGANEEAFKDFVTSFLETFISIHVLAHFEVAWGRTGEGIDV